MNLTLKLHDCGGVAHCHCQDIERVNEYLTVLSDKVDIWETGNEANGEWLGNKTDVIRKINSAYSIIKSANKLLQLQFERLRRIEQPPFIKQQLAACIGHADADVRAGFKFRIDKQSAGGRIGKYLEIGGLA